MISQQVAQYQGYDLPGGPAYAPKYLELTGTELPEVRFSAPPGLQPWNLITVLPDNTAVYTNMTNYGNGAAYLPAYVSPDPVPAGKGRA